MKKVVQTALLLGFVLHLPSLQGDHQLEQLDYENVLEVVMVTGVRRREEMTLETSQVPSLGLDNSDLMRQFPGANRNANGPLTRISQYRGLFGAQNNITIDGMLYTPGGPNWMDSPLSSIPQSQTRSVTVHRGLGSVNRVEEGLGNAVEITSHRGAFGSSGDWSSFGDVQLGYAANNSGWNALAHLGAANDENWLDLMASTDRGDDYEFDGGTAGATGYERDQYRVRYGRKLGDFSLSLGAVINRTGESGTPALPMDIIYMDTDQFDLAVDGTVGPGSLHARVNTLSVDHIMNNFTLRLPPVNAMGRTTRRETLALSDADSMKLFYVADLDGYELELGIDGAWTVHDADISDPGNPAFAIRNFNDARRDRLGLYAQLVSHPGAWDTEVGVRYNRLTMNSDEVEGNLGLPAMAPPMMQMQQERVDELANAFNASDRNVTDNQWSVIVKGSRMVADSTRLNLGLGRKVRSPSFQERYLWLPMEATAGLADGRTYIGNIYLSPEASFELTAGLDWERGAFKLTPEAYFRDVKDYIQGSPSTNVTANEFAMMMTGKMPLQFTNVDAEFFGVDLGYQWDINETWLLRGNLGYVRGRRTDVKDNLYRIAPLSSFATLMYIRDRWFVAVESLASARQDRVAEYNSEQVTAGWGTLSLRAGMSWEDWLNLDFGIENLADKRYQDHLGGYNRANGSDIPLGQRMYAMGRNVYLRINARW